MTHTIVSPLDPQPKIKVGKYDHRHWSLYTSGDAPSPVTRVSDDDPDDGYWFVHGRAADGYHHKLSQGFKCPYGAVGDHMVLGSQDLTVLKIDIVQVSGTWMWKALVG